MDESKIKMTCGCGGSFEVESTIMSFCTARAREFLDAHAICQSMEILIFGDCEYYGPKTTQDSQENIDSRNGL